GHPCLAHFLKKLSGCVRFAPGICQVGDKSWFPFRGGLLTQSQDDSYADSRLLKGTRKNWEQQVR
ncbi:hypothetical protein K3X14_14730, partial [Listeria monocytogenes]|nr:hypothetical protein [Listeria monocytogenes]